MRRQPRRRQRHGGQIEHRSPHRRPLALAYEKCKPVFEARGGELAASSDTERSEPRPSPTPLNALGRRPGLTSPHGSIHIRPRRCDGRICMRTALSPQNPRLGSSRGLEPNDRPSRSELFKTALLHARRQRPAPSAGWGETRVSAEGGPPPGPRVSSTAARRAIVEVARGRRARRTPRRPTRSARDDRRPTGTQNSR